MVKEFTTITTVISMTVIGKYLFFHFEFYLNILVLIRNRVNDQKTGKGVFTFANGNQFEGEFLK